MRPPFSWCSSRVITPSLASRGRGAPKLLLSQQPRRTVVCYLCLSHHSLVHFGRDDGFGTSWPDCMRIDALAALFNRIEDRTACGSHSFSTPPPAAQAEWQCKPWWHGGRAVAGAGCGGGLEGGRSPQLQEGRQGAVARLAPIGSGTGRRPLRDLKPYVCCVCDVQEWSCHRFVEFSI